MCSAACSTLGSVGGGARRTGGRALAAGRKGAPVAAASGERVGSLDAGARVHAVAAMLASAAIALARARRVGRRWYIRRSHARRVRLASAGSRAGGRRCGRKLPNPALIRSILDLRTGHWPYAKAKTLPGRPSDPTFATRHDGRGPLVHLSCRGRGRSSSVVRWRRCCSEQGRHAVVEHSARRRSSKRRACLRDGVPAGFG